MQTQPTIRIQSKPAEDLSGVLVILFGVMAAILFVLMAGEYQHIQALHQVLDGKSGAEVALADNEDTQGLIALVFLFVVLVSSIVFIAWFHRTYKNVEELAPGSLRFSSGWAIGCWFVPIINCYRPYQIATDIWNACAAEPSPFARSKNSDSSRAVNLWWTLLCVSGVANHLANRLMVWGEKQPSVYEIGAWVSLAATLLTLVSAGYTITFIKQLSARLERKRSRVQHTQTVKPEIIVPAN